MDDSKFSFGAQLGLSFLTGDFDFEDLNQVDLGTEVVSHIEALKDLRHSIEPIEIDDAIGHLAGFTHGRYLISAWIQRRDLVNGSVQLRTKLFDNSGLSQNPTFGDFRFVDSINVYIRDALVEGFTPDEVVLRLQKLKELAKYTEPTPITDEVENLLKLSSHLKRNLVDLVHTLEYGKVVAGQILALRLAREDWIDEKDVVKLAKFVELPSETKDQLVESLKRQLADLAEQNSHIKATFRIRDLEAVIGKGFDDLVAGWVQTVEEGSILHDWLMAVVLEREIVVQPEESSVDVAEQVELKLVEVPRRREQDRNELKTRFARALVATDESYASRVYSEALGYLTESKNPGQVLAGALFILNYNPPNAVHTEVARVRELLDGNTKLDVRDEPVVRDALNAWLSIRYQKSPDEIRKAINVVRGFIGRPFNEFFRVLLYPLQEHVENEIVGLESNNIDILSSHVEFLCALAGPESTVFRLEQLKLKASVQQRRVLASALQSVVPLVGQMDLEHLLPLGARLGSR